MFRIRRCRRRWCWKLALGSWLVIGSAIGEAVLQTLALSFNCAFAQITPDSTLPNNSRVTTQDNISIIEGGTQAGRNLFHSFQKFSVPTGDAAFFNNAANIQNIISRITGGSASNIDGIIGANGTANLFLINPNGIIFDQNAQLNIGGSFVASTANALQFGNIGFFSATEKNIPSSLLTINPSALLFNQINQNAVIQNNSITFAGIDPAGFYAFGLRVPDGKSLLLVGGDISMDGGELNAFGGRVELGGLSERGTVALGVDGDNLSLKFPKNVGRTEVSLTNQAAIYVEGTGGGNIAVNARNLEILGGSILSGGIGQGLGTSETIGEDITLNATGSIKVAGGSVVANQVRLGSQGNGGNIIIDSGSFSLGDGAQLEASTLGQGNAGNVTVSAKNAVDLAYASILNTVEASGVGKGGNIDINAATLSLKDGAQLATTRQASATQLAGQGDAGNVNIKVTGVVDIAGKKNGFLSGILSSVQTGTQGNGGNITIDSGSFLLRERALLAASTYGQGNAGNVTVRAKDAVSLADARIFSTVEAGGVGKGGNIDINAATLSLKDGAFISASTSGKGNAGNVTVGAKDFVSLAGNAYIFSTVEASGVGKGGNIDINAATLSLKDGAQLLTATREASVSQPAERRDAGNVNVNVTGAVNIAGKKNGFLSAIRSLVETGTVGNGGNITIDSGSFSLQNGASLSASISGQGNAGNVTVRAKDAVSLADASILSTVEASGVGKGGNIDINAATLSLKDGAQLLTITREASDTQPAGRGDAGNVNVKVTGAVDIAGEKNDFLSAIGSSVQTGTEGNGGNITIDSGSFSLRDGARLSAETAGQGNAGAIKVSAADFFTISGGSSNINSGLFVNSQSPTGTAGDIIVTSPKVTLDNGGTLDAESTSGNGGDINLQTDLLLLRRGAEISTTAGTAQAGGNGGNITINAPSGFIVAVPNENSDITANAFTGRGGNVQISAFGVYGTQFRDKENPQTSDITASSQFGINGTVELNTPDVDPNSGLINLPTVPVDTQLAQTCTAGSPVAKSSFTITGRGGLPPLPGDALNTDAVQVDLVTLNPEVGKPSTTAVSTNSTSPTPSRIVEATGWVIAANGDVILTSSAHTLTPHSSWQSPADCRAFNQHQGG
ncbi:MAG: filamentous hemagglutinin N-terminal domain-containing protein [Nostoc sp.]|uniref:two-partner secretion domain-containing protein n=1 Tax=Nostoc sp. TaxID=1180 RepID=UPI002FFC45BE